MACVILLVNLKDNPRMSKILDKGINDIIQLMHLIHECINE